MKAAIVSGEGVAGLTVAHLLRQRGWRVMIQGTRQGAIRNAPHGARERRPAASASSSRGPVLVLRDPTVQLLCDVWGIGLDAFPHGHRLTTRVVHTSGADMPGLPHTLADGGWTIEAGALQDCLRERMCEAAAAAGADPIDPEDDGTWHIDASGRPLMNGVGDSRAGKRIDSSDRECNDSCGSERNDSLDDDRDDSRAGKRDGERETRAAPTIAAPALQTAASRWKSVRWSCGRRTIVAAHADLHAGAPADRWSFESVPEGWLIVAPVAVRRAIVQLMVPTTRDVADGSDASDATGALADALRQAIAASRLAHASVSGLDHHCGTWHAAPVFTDPWPAPRTIRVGDTAMAFDPICGDGTGHAIRGAVLAAAALTAIEDGTPRGDVFAASGIRDHYRQRLRLAFVHHLQACIELYASLTPADPWAAELRDMTAAHAALREGAPAAAALRYRLVNSQLLQTNATWPCSAALAARSVELALRDCLAVIGGSQIVGECRRG